MDGCMGEKIKRESPKKGEQEGGKDIFCNRNKSMMLDVGYKSVCKLSFICLKKHGIYYSFDTVILPSCI